jgi:hypothetical protein
MCGSVHASLTRTPVVLMGDRESAFFVALNKMPQKMLNAYSQNISCGIKPHQVLCRPPALMA